VLSLGEKGIKWKKSYKYSEKEDREVIVNGFVTPCRYFDL
jgi:hypothetical protein